jgi:hypothetical protein
MEKSIEKRKEDIFYGSPQVLQTIDSIIDREFQPYNSFDNRASDA